MKRLIPGRPSVVSAALGGVFSGSTIVGASVLLENVQATATVGVIKFVVLVVVFIVPITFCVVGREYLEAVIGKTRRNRPWSHTVAEAGLRALVWFLFAGAVLILLGLAHLFYSR